MIRDKLLWMVSIATAAALTLSGMHAQQNGPAGFYRQMPGIVAGLLIGYALDSRILVSLTTIAANVCLYYLLLKVSARFWTRKIHSKSG